MTPELQVLQEEKGGCGPEEHHEYISQEEAMQKALQLDPRAALVKTVLCTVPQNAWDPRDEGEFPRLTQIAIISLINWMKRFGYTGEFYDIDGILPTDEQMSQYFKEKQPSVVGISAVVSTSYTEVKKITKIIRDNSPKTRIVLGGYMGASANVILRETNVDIVVLGDGEICFKNFLDYIKEHGSEKKYEELAKIKGLAYLDATGELILTGYGEQLPASDRTIYDFDVLEQGLKDKDLVPKFYFRDARNCTWFYHDARTFEPHRKPLMTRLWTAKGCIARCTFCQRFSAGHTTFDLKMLDDHLKELKEKYGVQFIHIEDETYGSNKAHAIEIAKLLKKHDMLWCATGVRCTSFTRDDIKLLRELGCTGLKFGVESGAQKILNVMEKRFTNKNVYNALAYAHENGLYSPQGFCIAMPGETSETIMETGRFLGQVAKLHGVHPEVLNAGAFYALPLPGTPLYEYGQLVGVIGTTPEEEEAYLTYISDRSPDKNNFINLTGFPMKDVRFWDFLITYEAMRAYYSNSTEFSNTATIDTNSPYIHNTYVPYHSQQKKIKPTTFFERITSGRWKRLPHYLANPITYLNKILINTPFVIKIPHSIFYPLMKNLLHLEFMIQVATGYIKVFEPGRMKKVQPLAEGESLRTICQKMRAKLLPPTTLTEKNRQILLLGR